MPIFTKESVAKYHAAARMIWDDLDEAFYTCRKRFGEEVACSMLVYALRQQLNDNPTQWPPPESLTEKVNEFLREKGLL